VDDKCANLAAVCSDAVFLFRLANKLVKLELVVVFSALLLLLLLLVMNKAGELFDSIARLLISLTRFKILLVLVLALSCSLAVGFEEPFGVDSCRVMLVDSVLLRAVKLFSIEIRWLI
jgi:hypothetical protein